MVLKEKELTGNFRLRTVCPLVSRGQVKLANDTLLMFEHFLNHAFRSLYNLNGDPFSAQTLKEKSLNIVMSPQVQTIDSLKMLCTQVFDRHQIKRVSFLSSMENVAYIMKDKLNQDQLESSFILEHGHGLTQISSLSSGGSIVNTIPIGGMDVSKYIREHLQSDEPMLKLTELKEQFAKCLLPNQSIPDESATPNSEIYTQAAEVLFSSGNLVESIVQFIEKEMKDRASKPTLYLSGGASLLTNFKERLQLELEKHLPNISVEYNKLGKDSNFFGACKRIKDSEKSENAIHVTLAEYKEKGFDRLLKEKLLPFTNQQ